MAFAVLDSSTLSGTGASLDATNLILTSGSGANALVRGQGTHNSGKWYFEVTLTQVGSTGNTNVGVGNVRAAGTSNLGVSGTDLAGTLKAGNVVVNGSQSLVMQDVGGATTATSSITFAARVQGDTICVALDLDNGLIWFRTNATGNWNNNAARDPATGKGGISLAALGVGPGTDYYPWLALDLAASTVQKLTANFGQNAFIGTAPAGFSGWTQAAIPGPYAVATMAAAEVWAAGTPAVDATMIAAEAWFSITPAAVATMLGEEVWFINAAAAARRQRRLMLVGG